MRLFTGNAVGNHTNWRARFNKWKRKVDAILLGKAGVTSDDLPDWSYASSFDVGDTPQEAAEAALEESGWENLVA